jgi:hypothetical protein
MFSFSHKPPTVRRQHEAFGEAAQEGPARGTTEGNEDGTMGDGIQANRLAERHSSHTQMRPRPRAQSPSGATPAVREKLIATMVEIVAEGGDPRLVKSRALA